MYIFGKLSGLAFQKYQNDYYTCDKSVVMHLSSLDAQIKLIKLCFEKYHFPFSDSPAALKSNHSLRS